MKKIKEILKKIKKLSKKQLLIILLMLVILTPLVATLGRFIYKEAKEFYLSSQNFYFNSDKLKDPIARYQLENYSGVDPYNITINMNSMKNNKVFAKSDINYDISFKCSTNITCKASKTTGTIYSRTNTDYFIMTLTPKTTLNEGDSIWLEVTTSSTEPYTKKISGRFVINIGVPGLSYEIVDKPNQPYFDFNITNTLDYYKVIEAFDSYKVGDKLNIDNYLALPTTNKEKCASSIITLSFEPTDVRLDMTSSAYLRKLKESTKTVESFDYLSGFTFKVDAISSEAVRFYKLNSSLDYTYPFVTESSIIKFDATT